MSKKIYTKTGDSGYTSLIGGSRVKKNDLRVEAYGTLDELNAFLGLLKSNLNNVHLQDKIVHIQQFLFEIGAFVATDSIIKEPLISQELITNEIKNLESQIDVMEHHIPELTNFIVPGVDNREALCHVSRTVCRRLERRFCDLLDDSILDKLTLIYMNRLSDYLFILGRFIVSPNREKVFL